MARLNIEDSLFKDKRFTKLCLEVGSRATALGCLVEAWMLAQEFVEIENPAGRVPLKKWEDQEIDPAILKVGFAAEVDGLIEVSGSKEQFEWLVKAKISGKRGGEAKAASSNPTGSQKEPSWQPNPLTLTPSLSLSPTPPPPSGVPVDVPAEAAPSMGPEGHEQGSFLPEVPATTAASARKKRSSKPKGSDPTAELCRRTWESYREAYLARWGYEPPRNAVQNTAIGRLVNSVGEDAPDVARFYVGHNKPFYVDKGHAMAYCATDAIGLLNQLRQGRQFTRQDAKRLELDQATAQAMRDIEENFR